MGKEDDNSRVTKEHESAGSPAKSRVCPKIRNLSAIKKEVKKADVVYIEYPKFKIVNQFKHILLIVR